MPDDKKISELPDATLPLAGTESIELVQGGVNKKAPSSAFVGETLTLETVDTTGGTITLDLDDSIEKMFVGSASFATPKTIALDNESNGLVIDFKFNLTNVAAVLTFPSTFTMQTTDLRWDDGAHTFTPAATGKHEFSATFDGTDWDLKATNPYS